MFLNFENLYKVPASFIEKEQTFTDIKNLFGAHFGSTYTKIGMIQRRLAWPLRKDDTQIREAFHIKKKKKKELICSIRSSSTTSPPPPPIVRWDWVTFPFFI